MTLVIEKKDDEFNPGPPEDVAKPKKVVVDQLPSKPSALVRVALKDLEQCESEGLTISMESWFWRPFDGAQCSVCLAGAVMAKSLKLEPGRSPFDGPHARELRPVTIGKLKALNSFRCGNIHEGLLDMGLEIKGQVPSVMNITEYHKGSDAFKNGMRILSNTLEFHGY